MDNEEYTSILSDNLDSLKFKRGGSLLYGDRYFSWGCLQMTLIIRLKNDPHSRRIMTGVILSLFYGVFIRRYNGPAEKKN